MVILIWSTKESSVEHLSGLILSLFLLIGLIEKAENMEMIFCLPIQRCLCKAGISAS